MKPIEFLQGKWLGHPLHPALVHIPIGAWIAAAVVDVAGRDAGPGATLPTIGLFCVVAGLIGALLAIPPGVSDWTPIKKEKPAWKLGLYHLALNLLAAIIWCANLGIRWQAFHTAEPITKAVIATSCSGAAVVIISGWIGSLMVFDQGTSVARQSKKRWRGIAQRGGANLPQEK